MQGRRIVDRALVVGFAGVVAFRLVARVAVVGSGKRVTRWVGVQISVRIGGVTADGCLIEQGIGRAGGVRIDLYGQQNLHGLADSQQSTHAVKNVRVGIAVETGVGSSCSRRRIHGHFYVDHLHESRTELSDQIVRQLEVRQIDVTDVLYVDRKDHIDVAFRPAGGIGNGLYRFGDRKCRHDDQCGVVGSSLVVGEVRVGIVGVRTVVAVVRHHEWVSTRVGDRVAVRIEAGCRGADLIEQGRRCSRCVGIDLYGVGDHCATTHIQSTGAGK